MITRKTLNPVVLLIIGLVLLTGCPNPMGEDTDLPATEDTGDDDTAAAAVTGIALDQTAATLTVGSTLQLTAAVEPAGAEDTSVTWSSGASAVATVTADTTDPLKATVTGVAAGTAAITVTTADGGFTATCTVTVEAAAATPPKLVYGFHFIGNEALALSFDQPMDETALDINGYYSVNVNSGTAVAPEGVIPKTASESSTEYTGVILNFPNHSGAPLALGDELTVTLSENIVSAAGLSLDPADRTITFPFQVDINAAGFDETMITYDSPAAGNVSIGAIGADPSTVSIFDAGFTPVNTGDDRDYLQVWGWESGVVEGYFAGSTTGAPNDTPDFNQLWNKALETVKTTDTYEPITIDPEQYYQYTLSYADTNQGGESLVVYSSDPVYMAPTLPLADTRVNVDVTVNYTGTTSGDDDSITVFLTYEPGGAPFAGRGLDATSGMVSFNDPLIPIGDFVYAEVVYDLDGSFSLTPGDPYIQHSTPIAAVGGSASITFDDSTVYSSELPEAAGGWLTGSSWGEMTIYITENAFSIVKTIDGQTTYGDAAEINNYGVITQVNNTERYLIGRWTHHPAGDQYEGKYMKLTWMDADGILLDDVYWAFTTEQEAVDASSDPTSFSWSAVLY